jgi:transposase
MSAKEQLELDVIVKVSTATISRKDGQKILNVTERTLRRYLADYCKHGVLFVQHGNRGRAPKNKAQEVLKLQVQKLVKEKYYDFNLTHCLEKLAADEQITINRETFRQWCHEIKMVKRAKRRGSKVRRRRDRMQQTGLMLQMDGSPHAWFGGKVSCLIAAIDDADSDVPFGEFFPAEDTISCMRVLQKIIERRGIFQILYVDRAGIFAGPKRAHFSQVKRALKELGIHIIFANSPEAKGRIERLWDTFQDRLVPELRIRKIRSYESANAFLQEQFLPNEYATKFKVRPANLQTAYKPLPNGIDLTEVFCLKEYRKVNRDHTYSWNNEIYRIESPLKHSIWKQKIELRTYQDLSWKVFFAGKEIEVSRVDVPEKSVALKADSPQPVTAMDAKKVRVDGHVNYLDRFYSVAEVFVGQKISVFEEDGKVQIHHNGKRIETHPKLTGPYALCSSKPEHLGPWMRAKEPGSIFRKSARRLGPDVDQMILAVLERGQGFIDTQAIYGIIGFEKSYSPGAINEACQSALDIESPTYKAVKIFLKLQGSRFDQRQAEKLAAAS